MNDIESFISLIALGLIAMFAAYFIEGRNPKDTARYAALSLGLGFAINCVLGFIYPPLFAYVGVDDHEHAKGVIILYLLCAVVAFTFYFVRRARTKRMKPNAAEPTSPSQDASS